jgi:hypothetical protein
MTDKLKNIKEPHLYAIFHFYGKPEEEHELVIHEVAEDRLMAIIVQLFRLLTTEGYQDALLTALQKVRMEGATLYPDTGMNTMH